MAVRALMEAGLVAGVGYWGFAVGQGALRAVLALAAPVLVFGFSEAVDFRFAGRWAEPRRLAQELAVTGLAALALVAAGQQQLGLALAGLSVLHHSAVYLLGERLIRPPAEGRVHQGTAPGAARVA